jgi:hypothetical protein
MTVLSRSFRLTWLLFPILLMVVVACQVSKPEPTFTPAPTFTFAPTLSPEPSITPLPPTAISSPIPSPVPSSTPVPTETLTTIQPVITADPPAEVAFDFSRNFCKAKWVNNGKEIICPGLLTEIQNGFVNRLEQYRFENGTIVDQYCLLTIPAYGNFQGIFGAYPLFKVNNEDRFRSYLTCMKNQQGSYCSVSFALDYYDKAGIYKEFVSNIPGPARGGENVATVDIDLSPLAGQSVRFVLVVRPEGPGQENRAVWIAPHIWRLP